MAPRSSTSSFFFLGGMVALWVFYCCAIRSYDVVAPPSMLPAAMQCLLNERRSRARALARSYRITIAYQVMSQITGPEKKEREHKGQEQQRERLAKGVSGRLVVVSVAFVLGRQSGRTLEELSLIHI